MKYTIINVFILACICIAGVSAAQFGWSVRIMHDGPDCAPEHKIVHISFEVETCTPKPLSAAKCEPVHGYEKSETVACIGSIMEIRDKIPEGATTIFAHMDDRKKDCKSSYTHGSYQLVGAENGCKPGYKKDSVFMSSCTSDGFEMQVCEDMKCQSGCKALPQMPMKEKTCTHMGGKAHTSYYFSCRIEVPTLTFEVEPEEDEEDYQDEL